MKTKRLRALKISEVSVVDAAENPYAAIKIMKRVTGFDDAGELLINGVPRWRSKAARRSGGDSLAKALDEIEINRAFAKAAAPVLEDTTMHTETDFQKAAVAKVDSRIDAIIAKSEKPISRDIAVYRMSQSRDAADIECWAIHKALAVVPPTPASEPVVTKSEAYLELEKMATKVARKQNISFGSAFAQVYAANPDLVAKDKAAHLSKVAGAPIDPTEQLIQALMASLNIDENHARGVALEIRAKRPPLSTLTVHTGLGSAG